MNELDAARFDRKNEAFDPEAPPTVSEVLNAAIRDSENRREFTEVIVLLHNPEEGNILFLGNTPTKAGALGLLQLAILGAP